MHATIRRKPRQTRTDSRFEGKSRRAKFQPEKTAQPGISKNVMQNPLKEDFGNPVTLQRKSIQRKQQETSTLQTKLSIGSPNDQYEQEADQVANSVMRMPLGKETEEQEIQTTSNIQTKLESSNTPPVSPSVQSVINSSSNGSPLNKPTRSRIEPVLGADLSHVSVHTDEKARKAANDINAKAFTHKSSIYLGSGQSANDIALMAHEATHVVQQGAGRQIVQRKSLQDELNTELKEWAKKNERSLEPTNTDYAFTLQEYAYSLTHKNDSPFPTEKPKKKKDIKKWESRFKKASLIAKMIMNAGKVEQKEDRAGMIAADLATVGLFNEAMEVAALLSSKKKKSIVYESVLNNAGKAQKDHLITITHFITDGKSVFDNSMLDRLESGNKADFSKLLGNSKLISVLDILTNAYKSEQHFFDIITKILVFNPNFRKPFSKWMWKKDKDFLFRVVDSKDFVEPGYSPENVTILKELTMKDDMPWVYEVKQKYYVDFLINLGTKAKVTIKKPNSLKLKVLRSWLGKNTEKIGQTLNKLFSTQPEKITEVYEHIADVFFYHVEGRGITADLKGKISKLKASKPQKMRMEADCDVLATYAVRLLKASGFIPIGYMAIIANTGEGHATALLKKDGYYYIVNNKEVSKITVKNNQEAIKALRDDTLLVWDDPKDYKVYYAHAEADGAMKKSLARTEESTRRKSLGPSN